METNSTEIYEIFASYDSIAIAGHVNPDGDAVSSSAAMALSLKSMGKKPIILLEPFPEKYKRILNGFDMIYDGDYKDLNVDIFISVDCADKKRLGEAAEVFDRAKETFNIDHHISNTSFAAHNIVMPECSSTAEVVFDIIKNFCPINENIASAIYAGIISDTNGFKNKATSYSTHEKVAYLIGAGIPFTEIYSELLSKKTITETRMRGKALAKTELRDGIAYAVITKEDMISCDADAMDLDGVIEEIISVDKASVALLIYPRKDGTVKASLRSREIDVSEIALKYGGGGHKLASGCNSDKSAQEFFNIIFDELRKRIM